MKKFIAVPIVAVVAAVGAASAAGFAGGVSAGPLQVGQTNDLECAASAKVIEWGYDDSQTIASEPAVDNARVQLTGSDCVGQAVTVLPINAAGGQLGNYRAAAKVPAQTAGANSTQYVRVVFNQPVPAESLKSIRISIDPGHAGIPTGNAS
jgi:N-acetylmuramoyl-L-alanine amidase